MLRSLRLSVRLFSQQKDPYSVLNVPKNSTTSDIKKQYFKLAKQYHPDYNPSTSEKFKEINAAYEILGDQNKRREHDTKGQSPSSFSRAQSSTHHDPFRNNGFYSTHRQRPNNFYYNDNSHHQQHQQNQQQADMWKEYYRQKASQQENFSRDYGQRMGETNRDASGPPPFNQVKSMWVFLVAGLFFSFFMTAFTIRHEGRRGQDYVKVMDPITSKVTIMPRSEFQKQMIYAQLSGNLGNRGH